MKKVLSLLIAYVFMQTQVWARSGGPFDNPQSQQSFSGSYAGVLIPETVEGAVGTDPNRAASIGLFTLAQPDVGPASGSLVAFVNGSAFNGTITGVIDPDDSSFTGIVDATSTFNVTLFVPQTTVTATGTTTTFVRQEFPVFAQGSVEADIDFQEEGSTAITSTGVPTTNFPARINGTAVLEVFFQINTDGTPDVTLTTRYEVDGFKQSDTISATSFAFGGAFGTGGTGTGGTGTGGTGGQ
jgi:hypothetical protein